MRELRRLWLVMIGAALAVATPGARQNNADGDAAIKAVVASYVASRDRGDAATLATLFTADVDQLTSSGEWRRGRDALVKGTLASTRSNAGVRTITIKTVRFPARDVAIADGEYVIAAGQTAAARQMWTSFVLIRSEGRWRISAIRNMLPAAPAS